MDRNHSSFSIIVPNRFVLILKELNNHENIYLLIQQYFMLVVK